MSDAGNAITHPEPQGVGGFNSIVVYGENLQVAVGLNHQLAVGNNVQICINPAGLVAGAPGVQGSPILTAALGSGLGGNMQLTMGTSASVVMGQAFDINFGPPKITVNAGPAQAPDPPKPGEAAAPTPTGGTNIEHLPSAILCGVLGAAALVWVIAYAFEGADRARAELSLVMQPLFDAVLGSIMAAEFFVLSANKGLDKALYPLFRKGVAVDANEQPTGKIVAINPYTDDLAGVTFLTALLMAAEVGLQLAAINKTPNPSS